MEEEADLNPSKLRIHPFVLAVFFGGLFLLVLGVGLVFLNKKPEEDFKIISSTQVAGEKVIAQIMVHIDGAVARPGVYKLAGDLRVDDVIKAAGGMTGDADTTKVNLAAKISDGQKIYVPTTSERVTSGQGLETSQSQNSLISINSASAEELDKLPGIGPVTAQKVISLRPYNTVDELLSKKAVNSSVFAKVKDLVGL